MEFTEFLLTSDQNRTVVSLLLGTVRVITSRIFGPGEVTEVHTSNTVAGVRGTDMFVTFAPPATTDVIVRAAETDPPNRREMKVDENDRQQGQQRDVENVAADECHFGKVRARRADEEE